MSDEIPVEPLTHRDELVECLLLMGFERTLCEQAIDIFNDDINSASDWLLRQTTLGQMPKRFKENRNASFNYTFFNSRVRLEPDDYVVTDYEPAYLSLIHI